MKIVCDACQAKYSIADEKIQGKAFKIRCKKCNHIIVVKLGAEGAGSSQAASAEKPRVSASRAIAQVAPAAAAPVVDQSIWHVVIDGEQVGPLNEAELKDRLRQGKINSDTLVWKEGFGDWTQLSAVPELTPMLARITRHPVAKSPVREPARASASMRSAAAPAAAAASAESDPFAAPTVISPAGAADLFASVAPAAAPAPAVSPALGSPFLFGGAPAQPVEPVVTKPMGGNGAGGTHLTGQRNENSVLFSLANLEALAVPQSGNVRSPSATANTEGSGLIDIRSMAAMTLSDSAPSGSGRSADALPTFSTPQFSPVAPVLLPMSSSGPPKWVYPALALLSVGIIVVGFIIFKVVTAPPPGMPPVPVAPAPVAAVPPAAPAPAAAPAAAARAEEAKPAAGAEEKPAAAAEKPGEKSKGKGDKGHKKGGDQASKGSADGKKGGEAASATPSSGTEAGSSGKPTGKKGGRSIDDMLGEVGSKKSGGGSSDESAAKPAVKLISLTQSDIVTAMKGVQPKVQACANQFKAPGTAMATISVASGGRVSSVNVTGKFAGTPTGTCVEAAAKSAKFPPCQAMSFPWPFTLSPR
jgi:predicted Zn finger-like uncharacterized protein